jgi:hypothetical protein
MHAVRVVRRSLCDRAENDGGHGSADDTCLSSRAPDADSHAALPIGFEWVGERVERNTQLRWNRLARFAFGSAFVAAGGGGRRVTQLVTRHEVGPAYGEMQFCVDGSYPQSLAMITLDDRRTARCGDRISCLHGADGARDPHMERRDVKGIHVLRLSGDYAERARQHGALLREEIPSGAIPALVHKNEALIRGGPGPMRVRVLQDLVVWAYKRLLVPWLASRLDSERKAAVDAIARETGLTVQTLREALLHVDGLMLLARLSIMRTLRRQLGPGAVGACTSAVVPASWTRSGRMLVARNLDYPMVGPWEANTTVLFHDTVAAGEIPHVAVTSAGVHTAGLTAMNRAGITIASHTIFGTEYSLRGQPFAIVGEEIIRRAESIDDAVDIARRNLPKNPWSYVISSAVEQKAVVLELTPTRAEIVSLLPDEVLSHANQFQSPALQEQEAVISGAACSDFHRRRCGIREALEPARGQVDVVHLAEALGSHVDAQIGAERVYGDVVSGITTVQSVVMDPSAQVIWVSNRPDSPCGLGTFVEVDVARFWTDGGEPSTVAGGRASAPGLAEAIEHYRTAYRAMHVEHAPPSEVVESLLRSVASFPSDGNLWLQLGLVQFRLSRFADAMASLDEAAQRSLTPHVRHVCELFRARAMDIAGRRSEALAIYRRESTVREPRLRSAYRDGLRLPYRASRAGGILLDLQFPDALEY